MESSPPSRLLQEQADEAQRRVEASSSRQISHRMVIAGLILAVLGIGIGVDYVIYVIVRMQEELLATKGDYEAASRVALTTTGRAVFFTMMAVVLGCMIFIFSHLKFHMELGLMVGTIIFLNGLGSIIFVPNLAYLIKPKFMHRFVKK